MCWAHGMRYAIGDVFVSRAGILNAIRISRQLSRVRDQWRSGWRDHPMNHAKQTAYTKSAMPLGGRLCHYVLYNICRSSLTVTNAGYR